MQIKRIRYSPQCVEIVIISHGGAHSVNFHTLAGLLNVSGNGIGDELVHDILQVSGRHLPADDVNHLLPDVPHLIHNLLILRWN